MAQARLTITPADDLIDVARRIRLEHVAPNAAVTISTQTRRAHGVVWRSSACFQADAHGVVDLTESAPLSGDYSGVSAMGLIWSQCPQQDGAREVFPLDVSEALLTRINVEVNGVELTGILTQHLMAPGVTREEIRSEGLVGTLFKPASPGPHPAVMILNGSGGGANEPRAALYASRGYIAFALAYFKAPGLSDYISNTPLEYFKKGLDWLRKTQRPENDFVALNGQSRGGELVLLLASIYPKDVSAVVAYVPGAVVHSGQNAADPKVGRDGPAWLLNGKPVVHVWENNRTASWAPFDQGPAPHRHERAILTALQDPQAVERARIPVEKIQAPIILLSATDDGSWPSSRYSRMVVESLKAHQYPYDVQWVDTEGGGHAIVFPYIPTTQVVYSHPVSGKVSTGGGQPRPNADSDEASWNRIKLFLDEAVRNHAAANQQR
ncbi:acyl-CoA thioesterase/BAAT N-terminal domain-containing protein [Paralcaligenes sp. KSB-10]|uniref:acyl-CoA thioesterase/bile acid-CoA:amino acid N-acyltransferase family protein n=1 Tax=Paralcaligenes sp. KSB-10 TaxID=2901142 RepID=UPI001E566F4A|nr:acyl-CoA thioesterase/bile acid-CoA:amino acid N-acyltransferase family protein [Paralcaligenes sp. KSB-10]UHL64577.1 acyl-CoA thioesterase/BAAT N-terminal domain-containing protein [Paralcaligenes sp. KSB-10]